jgi:hypothetical protein
MDAGFKVVESFKLARNVFADCDSLGSMMGKTKFVLCELYKAGLTTAESLMDINLGLYDGDDVSIACFEKSASIFEIDTVLESNGYTSCGLITYLNFLAENPDVFNKYKIIRIQNQMLVPGDADNNGYSCVGVNANSSENHILFFRGYASMVGDEYILVRPIKK